MGIETGKRYSLKSGDRNLTSVDVLPNSFRINYSGITTEVDGNQLLQLLSVLSSPNEILDLALSMKREVARGSKEVEGELQNLINKVFISEIHFSKEVVREDFPILNQGIN